MLESIQITNFAIIEALQLEFDQGHDRPDRRKPARVNLFYSTRFKLISGDRADSDSIKSGEDKAEICVCFDIGQDQSVNDWLQQQELASDGECIIRRVLYANGRSKAFINGYNAPLSQLRELAEMLVDIHGQHEHQSLQKPQVQQQLLDAYLGDSSLLNTVGRTFNDWRKLKQTYNEIKSGSQEREQRIDLLQLYCRELNDLDLAEQEIEQLQDDYKRLSHAGQLLQTSSEVLNLLYDNDENTVQSLLSHCQQALTEQVKYDSKLNNSHELINAALIQIQEASNELRDYQDSIDLDTGQLDQLNQRIALVQELARKHHVSADELPTLTVSLNQELDDLQGSGHNLESVEKALQLAAEEYQFVAGELSTKRLKTADSLSEQISEVMQQLGMQGGRFSIQVESSDSEADFRKNGLDQISYLVSANPGQPLKPLSKVASGGELSRISLAIQVILSESSLIPTLIFDEVDAGVGGGIAEIVGSKLRQLGKNRQVFCVTHLPQVASQAHHHYRVEKDKSADNTTTDVMVLSDRERLEEIARMLGGVTITEQTRAHASEMIAAGHEARN